METKKNPLSHLGWLGLLGVAGAFIGAPVLAVFLLFFFFFTYRNMPADELFWVNVRKAATRAFAVYIGYDIVAALILVALTVLTVIPAGLPVIDQGKAILSLDLFHMLFLILYLFVLGIALALCLFFFTLICIHRKEKKFLEAADADH